MEPVAPATAAQAPADEVLAVTPPPPACAPADWSPRRLPPLLERGKRINAERPDQLGAEQLLFDDECTDSPRGPPGGSSAPLVVDGVSVALASRKSAGTSGRGWSGDQCQFEVRLADGSGKPTLLGEQHVPPLTTITALVRSGSAVYVSVGFNGYTREFPGGGNRVLALDVCEGRVVWQSADGTANGGLLLLGEYLVAPYGFTNERRYVHVLDAHGGAVVQRLPVVENVCPSKSWAPHHRPGDRCDAPGQIVGAARSPRVEDGLLLVDTNTGSAAFSFR
jgi:hypothetical protein